MMLLLLIVVGAGLWTWLTMAWAYAEGERAGVLQNSCGAAGSAKPMRAEIALYYGGGTYLGTGTTPQLWDFSVRDSAVAADLNKAVGHRVQLHYTEHPGIPTNCFAETRYFVDRVTITDGEPPSGPGTSPSSPPPASAPPATPSPAPVNTAPAGATPAV